MPEERRKFRIERHYGAFFLRFLLFAMLGSLVATLIVGEMPTPGELGQSLLIVVLVSLMLSVLRQFFARYSTLMGVGLAWIMGLVVVGLAYLIWPLLAEGLGSLHSSLANVHQSGSQHTNVLRANALVLGFFVLPLTLMLEQFLQVYTAFEKEQERSEVKDLDMRIRPHFLFNSLNSVAGLIHTDPDTAEHGLMDLADMFRIIMTDKRKNVPISAELDMARKYVSLEKIRLGKRLKVIWELKDLDKSIHLPILTLQPLIENAIYHGIETRLKGGVISIRARSNETHLFISIINPLPEADQPVRKGNQIAQENLRNRLAIAYGEDGSINVMETDNFYTVTLKLPRSLR